MDTGYLTEDYYLIGDRPRQVQVGQMALGKPLIRDHLHVPEALLGLLHQGLVCVDGLGKNVLHPVVDLHRFVV